MTTTTATTNGRYRTMGGSVIWASDGDQSNDLDVVEASLRLPPPPRMPTLIGVGRVPQTSGELAAAEAMTVAPKRAA